MLLDLGLGILSSAQALGRVLRQELGKKHGREGEKVGLASSASQSLSL